LDASQVNAGLWSIVLGVHSFARSQMRRTFPARALSGNPFAFIRQGRFYQFAFDDDLTGPSDAPTLDIGCSSSIFGLTSIAQKLPNCRRLLQAAEAPTWQTDHHLMRAGAARPARQMRTLCSLEQCNALVLDGAWRD
jgi:hypothetical protein